MKKYEKSYIHGNFIGTTYIEHKHNAFVTVDRRMLDLQMMLKEKYKIEIKSPLELVS